MSPASDQDNVVGLLAVSGASFVGGGGNQGEGRGAFDLAPCKGKVRKDMLMGVDASSGSLYT